MIERKKQNKPSQVTLLSALLLGVMLLSGCGALSSLGNEPEVIDVKAKYTDLNEKRVAVIVSVTDHTEFNHPTARDQLTREITRRIVAGVPGTTVTDPGEVLAWQSNNPYWGTRPPSMIIRHLDVDRLVLVEVGEYRTHEPGNKHQLRGVIVARVNVVEAESPDPDNFSASFSKTVMYPDTATSKIGRISEDQAKVEMMTQVRFCEEVSGLFFDHKIVR